MQLSKDVLEKIYELPEEEQRQFLEELEEYGESLKREQAQTDFMKFVHEMWPGFVDGRHHKVMAKKFQEIAEGKCKRLIICMPPRHAIMLDMKIPTANGMKTMRDLRVGDRVFGPDGKPIEVIGKSNVFKNRELYRVWTDDNAYIDVDGEHLWTVRLDRKSKKFHDYTTEDLWLRQNGWIVRRMPNGQVQRINKGKPHNDLRLPMLPEASPVEYGHKDLLIDPYVLGVWLGDGSKNNAVITSHDDDARFVRPEIERRGYKTTDQSTRFTFGVLDLHVKLKELGVFRNKHIPRQYLEASPQQRRDLLKGLMDTDGNISKKGQCFFAQSNYDFILQVAELIRSLGVKANIIEGEAKIGDKSYGHSWKISFYASDVFHLPRKEERTLKGKRRFGRYIKIEKLEKTGDTQCIKVDREDGLFLAGEGYICTHNTKSEFGSYMLPAWFLGRYPDKKIIQCSNTAELAVGFGRKVRNIVDSKQYAKVFPGVHLRQDSKAAGRWAVNRTGEYFAIGVGGTVTGKGADLLIIDDPHSEQEAKLASTNPEIFDQVYEWYTSGPRQRLQPGGSIVVIMCMTGVSPVLMADKSEKQLKDIKIGDAVATYINGEIAVSKIANWRSSGVDSIYKIQTQSGKILRANEKHPFLVDWNGVRKWARLKDLAVGMDLVSTKDATDRPSQKQNPDCATHATQNTCTTRKTLMRRIIQSAITASGKTKSALAESRLAQRACAWFVTESNTAHHQEHRLKKERLVSNTVTESHPSSTTKWYWNAITSVTYAAKSLAKKTLALIGMESCASTTVTILAKSEDCSVMTVTSPLGTEKHQILSFERLNTYNATLDRIVSIEPDGEEEVFDIEVAHTENFIANGIVVHNTRWSKRDLVGRILKASAEKDGNDDWEIIEFPAILPSGNPLWPEFWSLKELEALKSELPIPKWNAQYQQQPTSEEGAIIKREWWRRWEVERPPPCEYILTSWDTAFETKTRSDYSACTIWGVFYKDENPDDPHIIMLDAFRGRWEFPELKQKVLSVMQEWNPDCTIIEKKASGAPLIYELRRMGVPVEEFTPTRGNDKNVRVNAVSDLFSSGKVWAPERRWADEVIEEVASFPFAEHDDFVDTCTQALLRFRRGGLVKTNLDEEDEPVFRKKAAYY